MHKPPYRSWIIFFVVVALLALVAGVKAADNNLVRSTWTTTGDAPTALNGLGGIGSITLSLPGHLTGSASKSGTIETLTLGLVNQSANKIWGGPISGVPAAPTFRSLVTGDIPSLDMSKVVTGTLSATRVSVGGFPGGDWSFGANTRLTLGDTVNDAAMHVVLADSDSDGSGNPTAITAWDSRQAVWGAAGASAAGMGLAYSSYDNTFWTFYTAPSSAWLTARYFAGSFTWTLPNLNTAPIAAIGSTANFDSSASIPQCVFGADSSSLASVDINFGTVAYNALVVHGQTSLGNPNALQVVTSDGSTTLFSVDNSGAAECNNFTTIGVKITGSSPAAGKVLTSDSLGNGSWSTPSVAANNVSFTTDTFPGPSGTLALNNNYGYYSASANVTISAISGASSTQTKWETLEVFNNSSPAVTITVTFSPTATLVGTATANPLSIPAGKSGFITVKNRNNAKTHIWTSVEQ